MINNPLFIVNGEHDQLYPAASLNSFIEILQQAGVRHNWSSIEDGGHNTNWLPQELASIEQFEAIIEALDPTMIVQHDMADVDKLPAFPKALK